MFDVKDKSLWRYHATVCDYGDMLNAYTLSIAHAGLMAMAETRSHTQYYEKPMHNREKANSESKPPSPWFIQ